jgi:hypothetical protein
VITEDELRGLAELKREGPTLDYKQDLNLGSEPENAEFIKDTLALANSGRTAYIVTGIRDRTWEPVGITKSYSQVQLNQILQNRTDPPISVEYAEIELNGHKHGVVKILGKNPPYLVMVKDSYGGIQRGTVFTRNVDMNEGARRADLDQMYGKVDLRLSHEVKERKVTEDSTEVNIEFVLRNVGHVSGAFVRVTVRFNNIRQIVKRTGAWEDISYLRKNVPTIQMDENIVHLNEVLHCDGAVVQVSKGVKQIEAYVTLYAMNMVPKRGEYVIPLES